MAETKKLEPARPLSRRGRWYHPWAVLRGLLARPKLIAAVVIAAATIAALPRSLPTAAIAAAGWNTGALVYLVLAGRIMSRCTTDMIRGLAEQEDESRFVFTTVILLAIASSFTAVFALIGEAKAAAGAEKALYLGLAGGTILTAWLVMQVVFTLHYAHDYYRPASGDGGGIVGGLAFPGDEAPDYWDFLYFTTSIGATSQTSDVAVVSKSFRRTVTLQAVLSFVFNTTILALAINVASSLIGGG
ncbi:MAG: DUF1345 domain-containing protein [Hyphomicrobiaceae bacterium]